MQNLNMRTLKYFFFFLFGMVISSGKATAFKVWADLPLPMSGLDQSWIGNNFLGKDFLEKDFLGNIFSHAMTETQEFLLKGDSILLIGFLLWILYILFCFPNNTLKKL